MPASRFARYAVPVSAVVGVICDRAVLLRRLRERRRRRRARDRARRRRPPDVRGRGDDRDTRGASARLRARRTRAHASAAPPGSLARQNAVRNPARTASTAAAVMIGLALITFVAVIGQGFKTSFTGAVDELFVADYSVSAGNNGELLTNKAAQAAATGARRRGGLRDAFGRGQGRRQDRPRHGRRREPDEGRRHRRGRAAPSSVPARARPATAPSSSSGTPTTTR